MINTYIILLRAVNVSGKNTIKMAELKTYLEEANFQNVKTYIQSGNIVLQSELPASTIHLTVKDIINQHFILDIDVFVLTKDSLEEILVNNPFKMIEEGNRIFINLLNKKPDQSVLAKLGNLDIGNEQYEINDDVIYFYLPQGMANSKLSNPFIEKKLKVISTGRNLNTMFKLRELANNLN